MLGGLCQTINLNIVQRNYYAYRENELLILITYRCTRVGHILVLIFAEWLTECLVRRIGVGLLGGRGGELGGEAQCRRVLLAVHVKLSLRSSESNRTSKHLIILDALLKYRRENVYHIMITC